ncbi:DUF1987 domain-containing protein [Paenibacillus chartarius]|uniref:DUF1987 domain-containing protein n=1 Tax=Paenibacillus chartarius TaxID=747481 RepID=A0ABV6DJJ8_9BACL
MDKWTIEATKSTPCVEFDPERKLLAISGQSYPDNAFKFYEPLLEWADTYLNDAANGELHVNLTLPYINTSSTKCFLMLLEKLEDAHNEGKRVEIAWYYNRDNDSELECAEEFKEDLTLPFRIIPLD